MMFATAVVIRSNPFRLKKHWICSCFWLHIRGIGDQRSDMNVGVLCVSTGSGSGITVVKGYLVVGLEAVSVEKALVFKCFLVAFVISGDNFSKVVFLVCVLHKHHHPGGPDPAV